MSNETTNLAGVSNASKNRTESKGAETDSLSPSAPLSSGGLVHHPAGSGGKDQHSVADADTDVARSVADSAQPLTQSMHRADDVSSGAPDRTSGDNTGTSAKKTAISDSTQFSSAAGNAGVRSTEPKAIGMVAASATALTAPGVIATIPVGSVSAGSYNGGGATAITPDSKLLAVANYEANSIQFIDTATLTSTAPLPVLHPADIIISPNGKYMYLRTVPVPHGGAEPLGDVIGLDISDLSNLSPTGDAIVDKRGPSSLLFSPNSSKLYVVDRFSSDAVYNTYGNSSFIPSSKYSASVYTVDPATNSVISPSVTVGGRLTNALLSKDGQHLYVTSNFYNDDGVVTSARLTVLNTEDNTIVATVPLAGTLDAGSAVDQAGTRLYVNASNAAGDRGLTVFNLSNDSVLTTLPVASTGNLVLSPAGDRLYAIASDSAGPGQLFAIDAATNSVIGHPVPLNTTAMQMQISPDGKYLYVQSYYASESDTQHSGVTVIEAESGQAIANFAVGAIPDGILVSPDGMRIYVTSRGEVAVIQAPADSSDSGGGSGGGDNSGGGNTGNGGLSGFIDLFLNPINGVFRQIAGIADSALDVIGDVGARAVPIAVTALRGAFGIVSSAIDVFSGTYEGTHGHPVSGTLTILGGLAGATTLGLTLAVGSGFVVAAPAIPVAAAVTIGLGALAFLTNSFFGL
ncbi:YncE family protein [Mycobacterium sp. JS623]|uniref:YncE family protein n=1 Tax=Mycobacterium sp. JS623 TaxID=212767 RepID=UPI0012FAC647|nr:hypothetical protein [Mycobacterium sp. JS623]